MCIFSFWSVLEQLVNCFLNASARNIMNCSKTEVFFTPIFSYFSSTDKWSQLALMMEGVLQQLVNCFLEASGGSLTFSHRLVISSPKSAWVELQTNLKHRECVIFHFGVCWNSLSTASWRHLQEISWIPQKQKFFLPLFHPQTSRLFIKWQMKSIGTNVGRCAAAARQLLLEGPPPLSWPIQNLWPRNFFCMGNLM